MSLLNASLRRNRYRKIGRPRFHPYCLQLVQPHAGATGYDPFQMAQMYGFPKNINVVQPYTITLTELDGGYSLDAINQWADSHGMPRPNIGDVYVDGATNNYTGNPQSADVEVTVDILQAIAESYSTGKPTNILVVFGKNSDVGFQNIFTKISDLASSPPVGFPPVGTNGTSWGSSEDPTQTAYYQGMDAALKACADAGITVNVASGDSGDSDGGVGLNVDFPGSSWWVVSCGATTIIVTNGVITAEIPWNAGGGATGGGYSTVETLPTWQQGVITKPGAGRGEPDLCAAGDPANGCNTPFGVIGGTSIVAPMMAAYFNVINQMLGRRIGLVNPLLYKNMDAFLDIATGNNDSPGSSARAAHPNFPAATGWDPASGIGALRAALLTPRLTGGVTPPPPGRVIVPNVLGMTLQAATLALQGAGLMISTSGPTNGTVFTESPPGGSSVLKGSVVSLTFAVPTPPPQTDKQQFDSHMGAAEAILQRNQRARNLVPFARLVQNLGDQELP